MRRTKVAAGVLAALALVLVVAFVESGPAGLRSYAVTVAQTASLPQAVAVPAAAKSERAALPARSPAAGSARSALPGLGSPVHSSVAPVSASSPWATSAAVGQASSPARLISSSPGAVPATVVAVTTIPVQSSTASNFDPAVIVYEPGAQPFCQTVDYVTAVSYTGGDIPGSEIVKACPAGVKQVFGCELVAPVAPATQWTAQVTPWSAPDSGALEWPLGLTVGDAIVSDKVPPTSGPSAPPSPTMTSAFVPGAVGAGGVLTRYGTFDISSPVPYGPAPGVPSFSAGDCWAVG